MNAGLARILHVEDDEAIAFRRDIGIGARDIDPARIGQRYGRLGHGDGIAQVGHIEQLHALGIADPQIAELDRACLRPVERSHRSELGRGRIGQVNHHEPFIGGDIGNLARQMHMVRPIERAARVPRIRPVRKGLALEEIVAEFAIGQRVDIDQDQPLFGVRDDRVIVDRQEGLLLVHLAHRLGVARRRNRLIGGERHAGRVAALHMCVMAQWGERCGEDALRNAFVGDGSDVIGAEAVLASGGEEIFAAQLQTADPVARAFMDVDEFLERLGLARQIVVESLAAHPVLELASVVLDMHAPVIGIGIFVQVGAQHSLRLVKFGDAYRGQPAFKAGPCVHPDKVHEIRTEQKQLRHDRVVVLCFGEVAIGAGLRLGQAHGVREVRREGLRREADGADRGLLHIDAFAVDVGRGQDQRAGGTDRCGLVALGRLVNAELEHLVARNLRVVGREIARLAAFIAVRFGLPVRFDRKVASAAARRP